MASQVLIVDDEPDVRLTLRALLEGHGWNVEEAADGNACLEMCADHKPEVLVLDERMPGLSGMEVAAKLRAGGYAGPIILYSAYLTASLVEEAGHFGVWTVPKPELDQLFELLTDLLVGNGRRK